MYSRDHVSADEKITNLRVKEIRQELTDPWTDKNKLVITADEGRVDQEAEVHNASYQKNTKTILKVHRKIASQTFIGFLNQNTGECVMLRLGSQNSATILETVQTLVGLNPGKKFVIVRDLASKHKTKLI